MPALRFGLRWYSESSIHREMIDKSIRIWLLNAHGEPIFRSLSYTCRSCVCSPVFASCCRIFGGQSGRILFHGGSFVPALCSWLFVDHPGVRNFSFVARLRLVNKLPGEILKVFVRLTWGVSFEFNILQSSIAFHREGVGIVNAC